jgi:aminopeptidase N
MPSLNRSEAAERSALLDVRSYHVDLDLTGDETFRAITTIAFNARGPAQETFLDLRPSRLHEVRLNGRVLPPDALAQGRYPLTGLLPENEVVVVADMAYSNECEGLHRFVDPADGRVYVYAFVYIDNAPRFFACFDQPDLKAPFEFTVTTPEGWQVLGNGAAEQTGPGRWRVTTAPVSTYLTTLVAGEYESFYADHDGIPLGLHCRASLADAMKADVDEVFEITGQCLDAFEAMFGIRYPFGKLDQVFAPEFSVLSLDHPGCVLLREQYLFRSAVPDSERETRAVVLAHGISLQWLAGLVTNAWWDDLWLGQAFADYMAHRVTSEATRFTGPLTTFAVRRKAQAYTADQRPSTHPVFLTAPDVQTVLLELDRISYFRGSSVLRQLAYRIGDDALRTGLRGYFDRHAFGTATFADFLTAISAAAGTDLTGWAQMWLKEPNVNTLTPELTVDGDRITAAAIRQNAPRSHPTLRAHTLNVGTYDGTTNTVRVNLEGERTELPQLVGLPASTFILLNDGDLTYAKIRFDPGSAAALPRVLPTLSALNRAMVWCSLLMAVQDAALPAEDHLRLVSQMAATEPELSILHEVLEQARNDVADRFLSPSLRPRGLARVADALRTRLAVVPPGDERQLTLFRGLIEFGADVAELRSWLAGSRLPAGLWIDADLAWRIRYRLAVLGDLSEAEIEAARAAEETAHAEQAAAKCRAARPDPAAKQAAWTAVLTDPNLSSYHRWALAEGFWQPEQLDLTASYVERFFTEIPQAAAGRGDLVLDLLVRFLFPRHAATARTLELAEHLLAGKDIPAPLGRRVEDFTDDLRRVVAARAAFPG